MLVPYHVLICEKLVSFFYETQNILKLFTLYDGFWVFYL